MDGTQRFMQDNVFCHWPILPARRWKHACVHACVYVCAHVCACVRAYVCECVYEFVNVCVCVCVWERERERILMCICVCLSTLHNTIYFFFWKTRYFPTLVYWSRYFWLWCWVWWTLAISAPNLISPLLNDFVFFKLWCWVISLFWCMMETYTLRQLYQCHLTKCIIK